MATMHGHRAAGVPFLALLVTAVVLTLATTTSPAAAQPWPACDVESGNYSAGSAYATNLLRLISVLRTNTSTSPALFASGFAGAGANVTASDCFERRHTRGAGRGAGLHRTRDVALVYVQPVLRPLRRRGLPGLSHYPNNTGVVGLWSGTTIPAGVDVAAYDAAITRLLDATSLYAVDSSAARMYFAMGQLVALAQCVGDLSPAQCRGCLDDLVVQWSNVTGFVRDAQGARFACSC
ncbi:hypothetical protein HU200_051578 [Digitaria exilis]|uniref:Gnk2-homologous domain-containing protein n=1 Tax=Digitaria exilis TaxID=1010633 RepID=A0A835B0J0_9POAL|nr:hypothetical protein HU200_051578 [Digitaria exilis]